MKNREKFEWFMTFIAIVSIIAALCVLVVKVSNHIGKHGLKSIVEEAWYGKEARP